MPLGHGTMACPGLACPGLAEAAWLSCETSEPVSGTCIGFINMTGEGVDSGCGMNPEGALDGM